MSEGNNYDQLRSPASNGDNVDGIGLVNLGVESDVSPPTTPESRKLRSMVRHASLNVKRRKDFSQDGDKDRKAFLRCTSVNLKYRKVSTQGLSRGLSFGGNTFHMRNEDEDHKIESLKDFISKGEKSSWDDIKNVVTADALCKEKDPLDKAFEVHEKLCHIAKTSTEKTKAIEKLAHRVEDFAYDLLDQVKRREEKEIHDKGADRYTSLFSKITLNAIVKGRQKFVSHPFIFKRVERRWKLGLSKNFRSRLPYQILLFLIMMLDAILTPVLLPFTAYVAYQDQQGHLREQSVSEANSPGNKRKKRSRLTKILVIHRDYLETPYVIFMKTQFMQLVFIGLFFRISMIGSSVAPTFEEYSILLFFCGFVLGEIQQYRSSASMVYFRDMWNYLDVLIMLVYAFVFSSRVATIIIAGDPFNNRLLELAHYGYGFDAMLLTLRFSSILELSSVIGPLQLALFRMCLDLLVILIQFGFVIVAFSLAITKCYAAETSFLTPLNNGSNHVEYCVEGSLNCFFKSARQLVWSIFGMTHFEEMESFTSLTSDIVVFLYLVFLVLSVIMLVNILVALLTTTYDKYKTNAEIEWKFSRAVVEEQYRRMHLVVVPFNIISELIKALYFAKYPDRRDKGKDERNLEYQKFLQERFFPELTLRYWRKYNGSFPLTVDRKLDTLREKIESAKKDLSQMKKKAQRVINLEEKLEFVIKQLQRISNGVPKEDKGKSKKELTFIVDNGETKSSSDNRTLMTSMVEVQIRAPRGEQAQKETEDQIIGTPQMQSTTEEYV
ncbi:short transient receptor potential channel 5-like [Stylophora pistillata]|uniref:short transient receptor potential channel 5-like n=1 Tax=Stylophora pistillata TaxID=50429 RepID=UPI000C0430F4|nr:short transient receptor potential channel 5-like [Stylophora pistillata]